MSLTTKHNGRPRSAPRPRWSPPSSFVVKCLASIVAEKNDIAVDFGAGYGRNTLATASRGWPTVAIDLDVVALSSLQAHYAKHKADLTAGISTICADLTVQPPLTPASVALGLLIDYSPDVNLRAILSSIRPGGHVVLETFGNRGENWRRLPHPGELRELVSEDFDVLSHEEKLCGLAVDTRCTTKMLLRRSCKPRAQDGGDTTR